MPDYYGGDVISLKYSTERLWCIGLFVYYFDSSDSPKSSKEVSMSLREVKKVVENFIADERNDLLVLKGEWGVGKTYFWNYLVRRASIVKGIGHKHYSYISLFGLNNLEDVRTEISASRVSSESIKESLTAREWAK